MFFLYILHLRSYNLHSYVQKLPNTLLCDHSESHIHKYPFNFVPPQIASLNTGSKNNSSIGNTLHVFSVSFIILPIAREVKEKPLTFRLTWLLQE